MKLTHKLCGAALVAVAAVAVAAPNTQAVNNLEHSGDAYIEFTRNTDGGPGTTITKPGTEDSTITNIPGVTDPGDFGIMAVTPLDFSSHEVVAGSIATREYFALPFEANAGNADAYKVENFVKFRDHRSTLNRKYTLSAEMTQEFTGTVDGTPVTLAGSKLTFKNLKLRSIDASHLQPANPQFATSAELSVGGGSVQFLENTEADKGAGDYELTFGDYDAGTATDAVKLDIDGAAQIFETKYTAKVLWTLADVK
ncbi:WxL domain-containing protein [Enterococcus sp. BWM-S5]|uniref:WxL domain-containing protein n=1 Tax=Enterococcus larvae TaxID=2794352 RepID=A0ABS4CNF2_9ENTE|nr:WxL domain-containing protein [Enterococcus larvae]MBP1047512.1 WxL domain-containing protein [Enterococcus larvae]